MIPERACAVALYVCHYNLCRTHEALSTTPAKALGIADRRGQLRSLWTPRSLWPLPTATPPDRRRKFIVIERGAK
jgi:hypothetical protein